MYIRGEHNLLGKDLINGRKNLFFVDIFCSCTFVMFVDKWFHKLRFALDEGFGLRHTTV